MSDRRTQGLPPNNTRARAKQMFVKLGRLSYEIGYTDAHQHLEFGANRDKVDDAVREASMKLDEIHAQELANLLAIVYGKED